MMEAKDEIETKNKSSRRPSAIVRLTKRLVKWIGIGGILAALSWFFAIRELCETGYLPKRIGDNLPEALTVLKVQAGENIKVFLWDLHKALCDESNIEV